MFTLYVLEAVESTAKDETFDSTTLDSRNIDTLDEVEDVTVSTIFQAFGHNGRNSIHTQPFDGFKAEANITFAVNTELLTAFVDIRTESIDA